MYLCGKSSLLASSKGSHGQTVGGQTVYCVHASSTQHYSQGLKPLKMTKKEICKIEKRKTRDIFQCSIYEVLCFYLFVSFAVFWVRD